MNFNPLFDRVVVRPDGREVQTAGGIIIPDCVGVSGCLVGEVVACGPGRYYEDGSRMPMPLKVGDRVLYQPRAELAKYSGCVIMSLDGVHGVLG